MIDKNSRINEFLEQNKDNNTAKSIFKKLCDLGYEDNFLDVKDSASIEQIILDLRPSSVRAITTYKYVISLYANFIKNHDACMILESIDRNLLWKKARINAKPKYISYNTYLNVLHSIECKEEYNRLYYKTLFKVIYEGIFSDDMSVIANLRASDIYGNIIELKTDDGYSYKMEFQEDLIKDLKELSGNNEWIRNNPYKAFAVEISGRYSDSCFKIENRKIVSETTYKSGYYNKLRKIMEKHLDYRISPTQLFVSGIMHRICLKLIDSNIAIEDAFSEHNRDSRVSNIIENELSRCEYNIPVKSFKELISGNLEIFI